MGKKKIKSDNGSEFEVDTETGEVMSPKVQEIKKKFAKLSDYKDKIKLKGVEYKPQEWINMSPAFKEMTTLPGIPIGHVIMNYGKSDVGKTTMLVEAGAYAQKQGILPILIITENKFSWERAELMGLSKEDCIIHNGVKTIEEGIEHIVEHLRRQEKGELPYDVIFLWDSIGGTPSDAENKANETGSGRAMMETAKVLRAKITRYIGPKINATREVIYPYNATFLIVNHAYTTPPAFPGGPSSLTPYGGDGVYLASTLVFRMGGVVGRSSAVTAVKDGVKVGFALKSALVVDKNHVTDVKTNGTIICTDSGFISDTKEAIDEYKERTKSGWGLQYDKYWDNVHVEL
jgi:RecA/RadA recombinase